MNTCPFCKREDAYYENYKAEKKTYKLWNCIYCNYKKKIKKEEAFKRVQEKLIK